MADGSPTPCANCLVQNTSIIQPVFDNVVISDGRVMSFVMMLGFVLILCSLTVNALSHRAMAVRQCRGAGMLRQLVGLGDLLGGAVIVLVLLYTYIPAIYTTPNTPQTTTASCCINFQSPDLVQILRNPLALLLVAFARHIYINIVFMQNWREITIGSTIRMFFPAIIGILLEGVHMFFAAVYPETVHRMISSLPWPNICMQSTTIREFDSTIIGLPCIAITIILLVFVVRDCMRGSREPSVSPLGYTAVVKVSEIPGVDTKERIANEMSCGEKSKDVLLLGSDYSENIVSKSILIDTKDVVLPIRNVQVNVPDEICPALRTSVMVSLNAFLLIIPLIFSMAVVPFNKGDNLNSLTFIVMLMRWTFLSACHVLTCLYYTLSIPRN